MNEEFELGNAMALQRMADLERAEIGGAAFERQRVSEKAVKAFEWESGKKFVMTTVVAGCYTCNEDFRPYLDLAKGNTRVAAVLYEEDYKRYKEGRPFLSETPEEAAAFVHYILQTLKKSPYATPCWDDWQHAFYESNGGYSDLIPGVNIAEALSGLVTNYDEIVLQFRDRKEEIKEILETGNLVIISNHCTWLNLPLIVAFLHRELDIPLDCINTLLGPALTTYIQGREMAGMSNLIKTVPDTPNGRLDDVAPVVQKNLRGRAVRRVLERKKIGGQVFVMSPGGTTDRVKGEFIDLLEASEVTKKFLALLGKDATLWPIATQTRELYADQDIQMGNFYMKESGLIMPNSDQNPLGVLKEDIQALNPKSQVRVLPESEYLSAA